MVAVLRACPDIDCTGCRCHAHPVGRGYLVSDPLRAPGTDEWLGLTVDERPRSGAILLYAGAALIVVGIVIGALVLMSGLPR